MRTRHTLTTVITRLLTSFDALEGGLHWIKVSGLGHSLSDIRMQWDSGSPVSSHKTMRTTYNPSICEATCVFFLSSSYDVFSRCHPHCTQMIILQSSNTVYWRFFTVIYQSCYTMLFTSIFLLLTIMRLLNLVTDGRRTRLIAWSRVRQRGSNCTTRWRGQEPNCPWV